MTFTDLAKSFARTVIPYVVGLVIAQAFRVGLDLHGYEAQLTVGVGTAYWSVARLAEHYLSPRFGWLLGVAGAPAYGAKTRRLKVRKKTAGRHKARKQDSGAASILLIGAVVYVVVAVVFGLLVSPYFFILFAVAAAMVLFDYSSRPK